MMVRNVGNVCDVGDSNINDNININNINNNNIDNNNNNNNKNNNSNRKKEVLKQKLRGLQEQAEGKITESVENSVYTVNNPSFGRHN